MLGLGVAVSGCGRKPAAVPARPVFGGPLAKKLSTAAQREALSVTVYNSDFGLVREVRTVDLEANGRTSLELADVAARIQPETVHVKAAGGPETFEVMEQNFRYDLLTPQKLLEKYVGQTVKILRWNTLLGREEEVVAKVLSAEPGSQAVFEIGGEVTYGFPGRLSFPGVPGNLVAKPTLVMVVGSTLPKQRLEISYQTWGMGWRSDYVLLLADDDAHADLTGWVTLVNHSGTSFPDADLKLVLLSRLSQGGRGQAEASGSEQEAAAVLKDHGRGISLFDGRGRRPDRDSRVLDFTRFLHANRCPLRSKTLHY